MTTLLVAKWKMAMPLNMTSSLLGCYILDIIKNIHTCAFAVDALHRSLEYRRAQESEIRGICLFDCVGLLDSKQYASVSLQAKHP